MIDQRAQNPRRMSALRIVEVVSWKWRAEFLEHGDKLAFRERITHVRLERQRDADPRGHETTIQLRIRRSGPSI